METVADPLQILKTTPASWTTQDLSSPSRTAVATRLHLQTSLRVLFSPEASVRFWRHGLPHAFPLVPGATEALAPSAQLTQIHVGSDS